MELKLSVIEKRIREKAAYDHSVKVNNAMEQLTRGCYYGNQSVPRLTIRIETTNEEGLTKITNRSPTIKEVGDLLARAIIDFQRESVETTAVQDFLRKMEDQ